MTGGQVDLGLSLESRTVSSVDDDVLLHAQKPALFILKATELELQEHQARLEDIEKQSGECLYLGKQQVTSA